MVVGVGVGVGIAGAEGVWNLIYGSLIYGRGVSGMVRLG